MTKLNSSETAPTEGTLKVFPNVILSNAYTIMRPFFRPKVAQGDPNLLIPENWEFGKSHPNVQWVDLKTNCFKISRTTISLGFILLGKALLVQDRLRNLILISDWMRRWFPFPKSIPGIWFTGTVYDLT